MNLYGHEVWTEHNLLPSGEQNRHLTNITFSAENSIELYGYIGHIMLKEISLKYYFVVSCSTEKKTRCLVVSGRWQLTQTVRYHEILRFQKLTRSQELLNLWCQQTLKKRRHCDSKLSGEKKIVKTPFFISLKNCSSQN